MISNEVQGFPCETSDVVSLLMRHA